MLAFTARGVAATNLPDLNAQVVVLAEDPNGERGPRLEISRALTYSKQDRELGQDTYCLSTQTGATVTVVFARTPWTGRRSRCSSMSKLKTCSASLGSSRFFSRPTRGPSKKFARLSSRSSAKAAVHPLRIDEVLAEHLDSGPIWRATRSSSCRSPRRSGRTRCSRRAHGPRGRSCCAFATMHRRSCPLCPRPSRRSTSSRP